jgi:hypothetical protein
MFGRLDTRSKMIIMDVIYRAGQNGVNPRTWPKLFEAAYNNDTLNILKEAKTKFKKNGKQYYDNARVERVGQYLLSCPEKALQQNVTKDGKRRKRVR